MRSVLIAAAVGPLLAATAPVAPSVEALPQAGPYFAVTFDAHAESAGAREILALLRERRVAATIFVTGRFAERFPAVLREAAADGHEIGNHTYSHPHLTTWAEEGRHRTAPGIDRAALHRELERTARAVAAATGSPPAPLWRAPYGEHNNQIRAWAAELGYVHVDWTRATGDGLDALDWVEDPRQRRYMGAEAMARRLLSFERRTGVPLAGSVVLMHLGSPRPDQPLLEALPILLDETDRRGIRPVPVSELIRRSGVAELTAVLRAPAPDGNERSEARGLP